MQCHSWCASISSPPWRPRHFRTRARRLLLSERRCNNPCRLTTLKKAMPTKPAIREIKYKTKIYGIWVDLVKILIFQIWDLCRILMARKSAFICFVSFFQICLCCRRWMMIPGSTFSSYTPVFLKYVRSVFHVDGAQVFIFNFWIFFIYFLNLSLLSPMLLILLIFSLYILIIFQFSSNTWGTCQMLQIRKSPFVSCVLLLRFFFFVDHATDDSHC